MIKSYILSCQFSISIKSPDSKTVAKGERLHCPLCVQVEVELQEAELQHLHELVYALPQVTNDLLTGIN